MVTWRSTMLAFAAVLLIVASQVQGNGLDELVCPAPACKWLVDSRYPAVGTAEGKIAGIDVFCHRGTDTSQSDFLAKAWTRIRVFVEASTGPDDDFIIYRGANHSGVLAAKTKIDSEWLQWPWHEQYVDVSPYGVSCWGISFRSPDTHYLLEIKTTRIFFRFPAFLLVGLVLFFAAPTLSQNVAFYYASSTSIGILAFLLVLVFIISRFVPTRGAMYTVLFSGWAASAYFFRYVAENARDIVVNYQYYIYGYVAVSAVISGAYFYWKGPPTNHRSLKLIQVFIQAISLVCMYHGTQSHIISFSLLVLVLTVYWLDNLVPGFVLRWLTYKWAVWFPQQRKLLTEQEFIDQGQVETEKALRELREFMNSPGASPWRVMRRLKDPTKFATFVETGDHIDEDQTFLHERQSFLSEAGFREHELPPDSDSDAAEK